MHLEVMGESSSKSKLSNKKTSLKAGRPPLIASSTKGSQIAKNTLKASSKTTRTLIRAHHNLHKSRAKALSDGNHVLVATIDAEIDKLGGLETYQLASLTGQSKERGGDSSTFLVQWLKEGNVIGKDSKACHKDLVTDVPTQIPQRCKPLRVLEVGALSSRNAISSLIGKGVELVKRIDLKSQEPDLIEEIDFMKFPVPRVSEDQYDVLSLSLVLNYVPDARGRGDMLKRTRLFLRNNSFHEEAAAQRMHGQATIPCLFVVLPLPCVSNSRYMTPSRFTELMFSLGYESIKVHQSAKLHYELFRYNNSHSNSKQAFRKLEVNPGKGRNNFCITLDGE